MKDMQNNQKHQETSGLTIFLTTFAIAALIAVILFAILGSSNQTSTEPASQPNAGNPVTSTEANEVDTTQEQQTQSPASESSEEQNFAVDTSRFPEGMIRSDDEIVETSSRDDDTQLTAELESSDQLGEVFSYYKEWLEQSDFEVRRSSQANGLIVASGSSSDVAIEASDQGSDGTEIIVTYNQ